jgi:hypothetical protein
MEVNLEEIPDIGPILDQDIDHCESDENDSLHDAIDEAKVTFVINMLKHSVNTETALRKLGGLAAKDQNQKLIRNAGGIQILLEILKEVDLTAGLSTKEGLALMIIAILCQNVINRDKIRESEGIPLLLRINQVRDETHLKNNLKALKELGKNEKNNIILRDGGLIEFAIQTIPLGDSVLKQLCLDIITILTLNNPPAQNQVEKAGGFSMIREFISVSDTEVSFRAVRTLGAISQNNSKHQKFIGKSGLLSNVAKMLDSHHDLARKTSAFAIGCFAENHCSNQKILRKCGVAVPLSKMLASPHSDDPMKESACYAIRSLSKSNQKFQRDFKEIIPTLVNLLSVNRIPLKIHAVGAIMELARDNSKNSELICSSGAVVAIVNSLTSENSDIQYLASGAIWCLARRSSTRQKLFREAKALEPLRILTTHENPRVKTGAEWALEVLT